MLRKKTEIATRCRELNKSTNLLNPIRVTALTPRVFLYGLIGFISASGRLAGGCCAASR
jgi:hypothetical protein